MVDKKYILESMNEAIEYLKERTEYSEVAIILNKTQNIDVNDGEFSGELHRKVELGFYIRLIHCGNIYYFYKSMDRINDIIDYMPVIFEWIEKNPDIQTNATNFDLNYYLDNKNQAIYMPDIQIPIDQFSVTEKIEMLKKLSTIDLSLENIATNVNLQYFENECESIYRNSVDSCFETYVPVIEMYFNINITCADSSERSFMKQIAHCGGLEIFQKIESQNITEQIYKKSKYVYRAQSLSDDIKYDYLALTYDVLGLVLHESFGHAFEGDFVITDSSDLLNKREHFSIPTDVNILIDPQIMNCGFNPVDYEGVQGNKKYLVKCGKYVDFIHNRETACQFKSTPSGSMRTNSYRKPPAVRMTSIYFDTEKIIHDFKKDFIDIEEIKQILIEKEILNDNNSILLIDGWIGGSGKWIPMTFDIDIALFYQLRKNEKTEIYYSGNLKGDTLNFLDSYAGCFYPLIIDTVGQCWKYDVPVLTSDGGPYITLFKKNDSMKITGA
jgi:TldD protein